jgi:hypothetical protein
MESQWTTKTSENNFRSQNSIACGILYIIGKLLELRCLKWTHIAHLDIWNTSYGSLTPDPSFDHNLVIELAVWLPTTKSQGLTRFSCLISIKGLHTKLWCAKVAGDPTLTISGFPLGNLRTKSHLDVGLVERCKVYYKGEGGGFSQVRVVVSLVCSCCLWFILAPKVLQLRTKHLMWVLCKLVWVSEACQLFLVPSQNSSTPLYPLKCCELGSVPRFLLLPLFSTWIHNLSISRSWECIKYCNIVLTNLWLVGYRTEWMNRLLVTLFSPIP